MPLNLSPAPRDNLTKQQKAEMQAAVFGLKATISDEDISFTQRLLAQDIKQEIYDTSSGNHRSGR